MKGKRKATKVIAAARLQEVLSEIHDGEVTHEIVRKCSQKWKMGSRGVQKYITAAYAVLKKQWNAENDKLVYELGVRCDAIYRKSFFEGQLRIAKDGESYYSPDYASANAAIMNKAKLFGLLKDVVRYEGAVDGKEEYSDSDLTNQAA